MKIITEANFLNFVIYAQALKFLMNEFMRFIIFFVNKKVFFFFIYGCLDLREVVKSDEDWIITLYFM